MLGLPKSTEISKQLPKKAIYAKFNLNTKSREEFDADISRITIVNEISSTTTSIANGETVSAIYVLLVSLKKKDYNRKTVSVLPRLIDQNMVLVLEYEDECRLAVFHGKLFETEWKKTQDAALKLQGIDLDKVWENIFRSLEGGEWSEELSLDENIARHDRIAKIQKEIEKLERMARKEIQPKKKFELVQRIKELKQNSEG